MKTESRFEIVFKTIVFFSFLTILVFTAMMLFLSYVINYSDWLNQGFVAHLSFNLTGVIMFFWAYFLRKRYLKNDKKAQSLGLLIFMIFMLIVLSTLSYISSKTYRNYLNESRTTAEFLEENFDEIIESSEGAFDSTSLRHLIESTKDTNSNRWAWQWVPQPNIGFSYPNSNISSDSSITNEFDIQVMHKTFRSVSDSGKDLGYVYELSTYDFRNALTEHSNESIIEFHIKKIMDDNGFILKKRSKSTLSGKPADELKLEKANGDPVTYRLMIQRKYLYILSVEGHNSDVFEHSSERFFKSFKLY